MEKEGAFVAIRPVMFLYLIADISIVKRADWHFSHGA